MQTQTRGETIRKILCQKSEDLMIFYKFMTVRNLNRSPRGLGLSGF